MQPSRLALLGILLLGCGGRPASSTVAGELHPAAGRPDVAARVIVDFHPSTCGWLSTKCGGGDAVTHTLQLDEHGRHREVMLALVVPGGYADSTSAHDFEAMRTARYQIAVSPDGHALGLARDGVWRYVGLDAPVPIFCVHRTFATAPLGLATRDLALEILRSKSAPTGIDHKRRVVERDGDEYGRELRAAAAYAAAHPEDHVLAEALAVALVTPCPDGGLGCDGGYGNTADEAPETAAEVAVAGAEVARSPALQALYQRAITARRVDEGDAQGHAIEALALVATAATQAFLFEHLATVVTTARATSDPDAYTCYVRTAMLRSLALVIAQTHAVSAPDLARLARWAEHDTLCSDLRGDSGAPGMAGTAGRAYATLALAASQDDAALHVVRDLAAPPCARPVVLGGPLPDIFDKRWPTDDLSCWARAAVGPPP